MTKRIKLDSQQESAQHIYRQTMHKIQQSTKSYTKLKKNNAKCWVKCKRISQAHNELTTTSIK